MRGYRLGKRAQQQEDTRRRIVEAAIRLHCSEGPARTTVSQIAELAGVQRHTYYAHFPDERDLFLACSGLALERDPLPNPERWTTLPLGRERIRQGLSEIYGWFERNEGQAGCVLRDMEVHDLTREIVELRYAPMFARAGELLVKGMPERTTALVALALDFASWRNLARSGHTPASAAELMADAIGRLD